MPKIRIVVPILALALLSVACAPTSQATGPVAAGPATTGTGASTPGTPIIIAIDALTPTSMTIHWNAVSGATGYDLFRDSSASGSFATQVNSTRISGTSYADTSLSGLTQYFYKLRATDGTGYSAKSNAASSTTLGRAFAAAFPAPSGLSASEGTFAGYVRLTWGTIPGYSVSGYNVYRSTSNSVASSGVLVPLNPSPLTAETYDDTSATAGTIYYYWVCGVSGSSEGEYTLCKFGYR